MPEADLPPLTIPDQPHGMINHRWEMTRDWHSLPGHGGRFRAYRCAEPGCDQEWYEGEPAEPVDDLPGHSIVA